MTTSVVLYFHAHQPFRLRRYSFFDIGRDDRYFDDAENARIVRRVAERCYLPTTALLRRAIERSEGRFRCALSITGTLIDQLERWAPEALDAFRALHDTGGLEVVAETSHHSLAFLGNRKEFRAQVLGHAARLERVFGRRPRTFRNTELVLDDRVARAAEEMGFEAILGEGADHLLGWRTPHRVWRPEGCERIALLLRSYRFSDDIAFRFSNRGWEEWPLTPEKFARWLAALPPSAEIVNLFMDFETAGEHQWKETGILDFLEGMPAALLAPEAEARFVFRTPAEAAAAHRPAGVVSAPRPVSWADQERDLSAWLGNAMQKAAHDALYDALGPVRRSGSADLLEAWRKLSTSDHVYYMCTKYFSDGDVHKYFSPYDAPHDAHVAFLNALDDLVRRAARAADRPGRTGRKRAGAAHRGARARGGTARRRAADPPRRARAAVVN